MQEAQRLRPLCPKVNQEDHEASAEGDGVGLLQLEGERGAGVPQESGNDEWCQIRQLLDDKLEFFMGQHGAGHFLQGGVPCHQSKIVMALFHQRLHIQLVKWPGNSPRTQSHQDRLGGDEEEAGGPQLHKPPAVEGGDLEGVA